MIICDLCGIDINTIDVKNTRSRWSRFEYFGADKEHGTTIICALCNDQLLDEIKKVTDPINEKWKDKVKKAIDKRNNQKAKYDTSK